MPSPHRGRTLVGQVPVLLMQETRDRIRSCGGVERDVLGDRFQSHISVQRGNQHEINTRRVETVQQGHHFVWVVLVGGASREELLMNCSASAGKNDPASGVFLVFLGN